MEINIKQIEIYYKLSVINRLKNIEEKKQKILNVFIRYHKS